MPINDLLSLPLLSGEPTANRNVGNSIFLYKHQPFGNPPVIAIHDGIADARQRPVCKRPNLAGRRRGLQCR